ncbi:branched-chain amino acid ABC transporter substrate-binding protein [Burkholderia ubonensis]|uniref:branched-chain amino acid ABC transporter substrate-binding protein n=1 Tax=Burkholderia ubonensis TaxID=101571 RepID=UPI0018DFE486|nr:branched-chain amino acid ABC transporter substrate-binding protein [Burkholderia ubonensis]
MDSQVVTIGIAGPMTGPIAHLGKDIESGVKMAVEEINSNPPVIGGRRVLFKTITVDDQSDPRIAVQAANHLVDKNIAAVIGHYNSGTTIPASKIYASAGIPQISPGSTNPEYTHQGLKTAFRNIANDDQQGIVVAKFAYTDLKARKVAVVDDRTAAGQGQADKFVEQFTKLGGVVITREYTTSTATNFTSILTKIKAYNPDIIFYASMDAQAGPMVKQMKSLGMKTKILSMDGVMSNLFIKLAGDAAEGHMASSVGLPQDKMPGFLEFSRKFTAKYGEMQSYSPYSYDAFMVLVAAMKKGNSTDPARFSPKIHEIHYDGVAGSIQFDKNGDLRDGIITIYRVKNGRWVAISSS